MDEPPRRDAHQRLRLGFVGDLILGRRVSAKLARGFPPANMWGDLRPAMLAADAIVGNLEGPITTRSERWPLPKAFYFRADPRSVEVLTAGNVRCLALANNHMLDFRAEGLADTRRTLDAAGIAHAGAGANLKEAAEPAVFSAGGRKVGFVSIANTVPAFAAKPDRPGTNYWTIRANRENLGKLAILVYQLRQRGAEVLILSVHWGPNYRWWPPAHYRAFARAAIGLGFDIVHGHSAHVLQAAEFHGNGLILYDTADYIDDFWPIPGLPTWRSFLFLVDVRPGEAPGLTMIPAHLTPGRVDIAKGEEAVKIRQSMIRRCRGYAIRLSEEDGALVGRPPGAPA